MPGNEFKHSAPFSVGHPELLKDYHGLVARAVFSPKASSRWVCGRSATAIQLQCQVQRGALARLFPMSRRQVRDRNTFQRNLSTSYADVRRPTSVVLVICCQKVVCNPAMRISLTFTLAVTNGAAIIQKFGVRGAPRGSVTAFYRLTGLIGSMLKGCRECRTFAGLCWLSCPSIDAGIQHQPRLCRKGVRAVAQ